MVAGIAVHAALEYYYSLPVRDEIAEEAAIQVMHAEWDRFEIDRAMMDQRYVHLSNEHLEQILRNYFHYWTHSAIDIYEPISGLSIDDINLDDVIAAKFRTTSTGEVVLGESSLIMRFKESGGNTFVYSGKPDLPVTKHGAVWAMDHKSTGSYLSDHWAKNFEVSNQLRGYMAMLSSLLGVVPHGGVINGIYVGKYATNPNSKATKFQRFEFSFAPKHIQEAIDNQYAWVQAIEHFRAQGYWPQGCGYGGCDMPSLCKGDPDTRAEILATDYQPSTRDFWNL